MSEGMVINAEEAVGLLDAIDEYLRRHTALEVKGHLDGNELLAEIDRTRDLYKRLAELAGRFPDELAALHLGLIDLLSEEQLVHLSVPESSITEKAKFFLAKKRRAA